MDKLFSECIIIYHPLIIYTDKSGGITRRRDKYTNKDNVMARISLWNPVRGADFNFTDKTIGENFRIAGDGILIHMYEGPQVDSAGSTDTTITSIQDVLFLENTSRKYNPNVIELHGHHQPQDITYDLSQFGIMLSSDTIRIQFHYNDMVDTIGRKLIPGDVLEFPSMRDVPIFDNAVGINKYYVVQDALWAAGGYGQKWFPHIWLIRAKLITASPEFKEIMDSANSGQTAGGSGQGIGIMPPGTTEVSDLFGNPTQTGGPNIENSLNLFCKIINISDQIVEEAKKNAFFDPKFFESMNLYIYIDPDTDYPVVGSNFYSGDGEPPNGGPLLGAGISFPPGMRDGEYYLRLDYYPSRLFQKQGATYKLIEIDVLKVWSSYNRILDTHIDNNNTTQLQDGTIISEKQPLSQVLRQKVDLYATRKTKVLENEATRTQIADNLASTRGY